MAEPAAWNGDALIQSLSASQLEGDAVPVIELDELAQLRPEEGAVGEDGAAHDRIAKIAALGDYPAHGAFGIIAQVDRAGARLAQILMGDQGKVAKANRVGDSARNRTQRRPTGGCAARQEYVVRESDSRRPRPPA